MGEGNESNGGSAYTIRGSKTRHVRCLVDKATMREYHINRGCSNEFMCTSINPIKP